MANGKTFLNIMLIIYNSFTKPGESLAIGGLYKYGVKNALSEDLYGSDLQREDKNIASLVNAKIKYESEIINNNSLSELAEEMAANNNDCTAALIHVHLPNDTTNNFLNEQVPLPSYNCGKPFDVQKVLDMVQNQRLSNEQANKNSSAACTTTTACPESKRTTTCKVPSTVKTSCTPAFRKPAEKFITTQSSKNQLQTNSAGSNISSAYYKQATTVKNPAFLSAEDFQEKKMHFFDKLRFGTNSPMLKTTPIPYGSNLIGQMPAKDLYNKTHPVMNTKMEAHARNEPINVSPQMKLPNKVSERQGAALEYLASKANNNKDVILPPLLNKNKAIYPNDLPPSPATISLPNYYKLQDNFKIMPEKVIPTDTKSIPAQKDILLLNKQVFSPVPNMPQLQNSIVQENQPQNYANQLSQTALSNQVYKGNPNYVIPAIPNSSANLNVPYMEKPGAIEKQTMTVNQSYQNDLNAFPKKRRVYYEKMSRRNAANKKPTLYSKFNDFY